MRPRAPFGFRVAAAFSAWFCLAMVVIVCAADPAYDHEWMALGRGVAALLAGLSAVATEALWRARPWVWRASLTLALAYAAAVLVAFSADSMSSIMDGVAVLLVSATVVVPLLAHVRRRAKAMWPKPPPRPAARPGGRR